MLVPFQPKINLSTAKSILHSNWKFKSDVEFTELPSYNCRTYLVKDVTSNNKWVFKIEHNRNLMNTKYIKCVELILDKIDKSGYVGQKMIRTIKNEAFVQFDNPNDPEEDLVAFTVTYVEGKLVYDMRITKDLCYNLAKQLFEITECVDEILESINALDHKSDYVWDLRCTSKLINIIPQIRSEQMKSIISDCVADFETKIKPKFNQLTYGFIHGDPNEKNLVIPDDNMNKLVLIDWEDSALCYKIYDVAILIYSLMMMVKIEEAQGLTPNISCKDVGRYCWRGYKDADTKGVLNQVDTELLAVVVQTRIAISFAVGQYTTGFVDTNDHINYMRNYPEMLLRDIHGCCDEYQKYWTQ